MEQWGAKDQLRCCRRWWSLGSHQGWQCQYNLDDQDGDQDDQDGDDDDQDDQRWQCDNLDKALVSASDAIREKGDGNHV